MRIASKADAYSFVAGSSAGLCSIYQGIYQVTMSPELRHKKRNNVLSL